MDKQTFLEKMLYLALEGTEPGEELKKIIEEKPEWHKDHLKLMEDKAIGLERSPSRRRLKTSGDYVGAKGETNDQMPPRGGVRTST